MNPYVTYYYLWPPCNKTQWVFFMGDAVELNKHQVASKCPLILELHCNDFQSAT